MGGVKTGHPSKVGASTTKQTWLRVPAPPRFWPLHGTSCSTSHWEHSEFAGEMYRKVSLRKEVQLQGRCWPSWLRYTASSDLCPVSSFGERVGTSNILTSSFENSNTPGVKKVLADCCLLGCLIVCSLDTWLRSPLREAIGTSLRVRLGREKSGRQVFLCPQQTENS